MRHPRGGITGRDDSPRFAIVGFVLAAVFVQMRLLANLSDGMVAAEQNRRSPLGEMFNEVPDRVSGRSDADRCQVCLGGSPVWGFFVAVLAVFVAYIRVQGKVAGGARYPVGRWRTGWLRSRCHRCWQPV
ncbi:MAG: hypothetical protein R3B91_21895 [Planctomycetaceae bacterium]